MDAHLCTAARCVGVPVSPCRAAGGGFHRWSLCSLVTWVVPVTWADGLSPQPLHRWEMNGGNDVRTKLECLKRIAENRLFW